MSWRDLAAATSFVAGLICFGSAHVAAQDTAPLNPMKMIARSALKGFLERPLFDPSRRLPLVVPPVIAEVPHIMTPVEAPPTLRLLGVIHGKRDMVVVQRDGDSKTTILRTGDHIGNWVLRVLPPLGVRLQDGNRTVDYALFAKSGAGPIPGALPAVAADAAAVPEKFPADAFNFSPN